MAERGYNVSHPIRFTLYRSRLPSTGYRNILLFGEDHDNITQGRPDSITATDFILHKLEEDGTLNVYVEMPEGEELYEGLGINQLERWVRREQTRKSAGLRYDPRLDRIHNIDRRYEEGIIPEALHRSADRASYEPFKQRVRDFVMRREPRLENLLNETFEEADDELGQEIPEGEDMDEDEDEGEDEGDDMDDDEDIRADDDLGYAKTAVSGPIVEAEMSHTIRHNPHNASDMIFYTGDAHTENLKEHILNPSIEYELLYDRRHTDPMGVTRF
jgi:hypothetical protein